MMEILITLLYFYSMIGLFAAFFYPHVRNEFSEEWFLIRKPGETGLKFIGKVALVFLLWPAPVGAVVYYGLTEHIIPWLTEPKT